jgi:hypothetical protein
MFTGVVDAGALASEEEAAEAAALLGASADDEPDEQAASPRRAVPMRAMEAARLRVEVMEEG